MITLLTGQHSGEEDVVREGDKATFSQCVKYAVLICKLLPLLGNLLLIQGRTKQNGRSYITYNVWNPAHALQLLELPQVWLCVCESKSVCLSVRIDKRLAMFKHRNVHTYCTFTHT